MRSIQGGSELVGRWDMLPFHTGHYPARGTWVACAIEANEATDLSPEPKVHIAKIYWADTASKWNEEGLYQDAHRDVKIPGLPCPKATLHSPAQLHRSSRRSSHQDHAALAGAPQTGAQPEIIQAERNLLFPTPDRAEANEMTKNKHGSR